MELDGVLVHVDAMVRSRIGSGTWRSIMSGRYEFSERQLLKATVRSGDRVLEIGACLGVISILAAHLTGEQNVISYEANPELERDIRANFELNGLFPELIMKAVTTEGGSLPFNVRQDVYSSSFREIDGSHETQVKSVSINQVIADHGPNVLVIDAEGAEVELLRHADLKNIRAVIVEFHPRLTGEDGVLEAKKTLTAKGFVSTLMYAECEVFERTTSL